MRRTWRIGGKNMISLKMMTSLRNQKQKIPKRTKMIQMMSIKPKLKRLKATRRNPLLITKRRSRSNSKMANIKVKESHQIKTRKTKTKINLTTKTRRIRKARARTKNDPPYINSSFS